MPTPAIPQVKSLTFVTLRNELQSRLLQDVGEHLIVSGLTSFFVFGTLLNLCVFSRKTGAWVSLSGHFIPIKEGT